MKDAALSAILKYSFGWNMDNQKEEKNKYIINDLTEKSLVKCSPNSLTHNFFLLSKARIMITSKKLYAYGDIS